MTCYALLVKKQGDPRIAKFFKDIRALYNKRHDLDLGVNAFADLIGVDGANLGQVELGKKMPGTSVLTAIRPYILEVQRDPAALLYLWLETNGLKDYVQDVRRRAA